MFSGWEGLAWSWPCVTPPTIMVPTCGVDSFGKEMSTLEYE